MNWDDIGQALFGGSSRYGEILQLVQNSVWAGAVLGIVGGLIGVFVMQRDMAFAVHGISELSFAGAAAALLFGVDVVTGSIVGSLIAAGLIGWLGARARDRNSIIGVLMPFGLGIGILCISLYNGRSANRFSLLTGQIVSVQSDQLAVLIVLSALVLVALLLIWRPLTFDSLDPQSAAARGVPTMVVSFAFMLLLGIVVAVAVHIIGALLVLSLLVTPAAAAMRVSTGPVAVPLLAAGFGVTAAVGGILLAIAGTGESATRLTAMVGALAARRNQVKALQPSDDDVVDPYRKPWSVYEESAAQLLPALTQVQRVVSLALRK